MAGGMRISVFGAGYVGLVIAACLAEVGHHVTSCDTAADKIALLRDCGEPLDLVPALGSHDAELAFQSVGLGAAKLPSNEE